MRREILGMFIYGICIYVMLDILCKQNFRNGVFAGRALRDRELDNLSTKVIKRDNVLRYPFNPKKTAELYADRDTETKAD